MLPKLSAVALAVVIAVPAIAGELEDRTTAARAVVKEFGGKLQGELGAALKAGGPENALQVCNAKAPAIAAELSRQHTMKVARTSLRLRNPNNLPDAWETKVLKDFEARKTRGEDAAKLEYAEIVTTGGKREFRYMKAIAIAPDAPCLACHGGNLDPKVSAKLKELYPQDKATGFKTGDLRGAFTLRQAM
jgi:hypothetical protein